MTADQLEAFVEKLRFVRQMDGPQALSQAVADAEAQLGEQVRRLHYLSVPPRAAVSVIEMLLVAGLVDRSRVIMEKPFGNDLESAIRLNAKVHETFRESQIFRIDHLLGKEPAHNILAFRFAIGLFEPIWGRNFIHRVQIDIPETLGLESRVDFYDATGAYRDMVVTHLQVLAFIAIEPRTALEPRAIGEEKNKVFRSLMPIDPRNVVRGQYDGYRDEDGVPTRSATETFIALQCALDNWRWAGVPLYLRTGKRMAEGQRIVSIAFREAPKSMFPSNSGIGTKGPDHLTFDLADASRISLSVYGKRPGPGMRLEKLSMQFATSETEEATDILEAYERLILDTLRGDHTLFTTAEGIESLWERSTPLLEDPPPVRPHAQGSWGPQCHPPAHRAKCVAAAVRASLAGAEIASWPASGRCDQEPVRSIRFARNSSIACCSLIRSRSICSIHGSCSASRHQNFGWRRNQRRASRLPISISTLMNCLSNSKNDSSSPHERCAEPSARAITPKSTLRMPRRPP